MRTSQILLVIGLGGLAAGLYTLDKPIVTVVASVLVVVLGLAWSADEMKRGD